MQKLLVGINYSEQSSHVLRYAFRIAQYLEAQLIVSYYLDYDNREVSDLGVKEDEDWREIHEAFRLKQLRKLKEFVKEHQTKQFHHIHVQVEVGFGSAHEELRRLAKREEADLLILGKFTANGWSLFLDTADKVIQWTHCPVLIVPEDFSFEAIERIVYASDFELEDCEALLYLLSWITAFKAKLTCLHICKRNSERFSAERKMRILKQLFPHDNIEFTIIEDDVEVGIDRFVDLTQSDLVVTLHRNRHFWASIFNKSITKAIVRDVKVPMLIFRQY